MSKAHEVEEKKLLEEKKLQKFEEEIKKVDPKTLEVCVCVCIYTLMNLFFAKISRYPENKLLMVILPLIKFFQILLQGEKTLLLSFYSLLWFLIIENLALRNV